MKTVPALLVMLVVLAWAASAPAEERVPDLKAWLHEKTSVEVCPLDLRRDGAPTAVVRIYTTSVEEEQHGIRWSMHDYAVEWASVNLLSPLPMDWTLHDYPQMVSNPAQLLVYLKPSLRFHEFNRPGGLLFYLPGENGKFTLVDTRSIALPTPPRGAQFPSIWRGDGPITSATPPFGKALMTWARNRGASLELAPEMIPNLPAGDHFVHPWQWYPAKAWRGCAFLQNPLALIPSGPVPR